MEIYEFDLRDDEDDVQLYPPWKEALEVFKAAGKGYGDTIHRDWFIAAFGMRVLSIDEQVSLKEVQEYQFSWIQNFEPFRKAVVEQLQMDIRSMGSGGLYQIVPVKEQAPRALKDYTNAIVREHAKAHRRIRNVNVALLSQEDRKIYIDSLAKLGELDQVFSRQQRRKRLPMDED